ncbi:polyphosphate kinase 2 family protein [Afipia felis]|uniref:Polyphosphate:nucleotide phosphotransferase, PPK2 family n=2 Tax=Afipia felis TaxID=1035 RepID=A0A380W6V4_AFIFE|nr:polyphosphate kinase 2 family protein [Afipia felis]EKS31385.1 PPK2 family polyphosphate:nucleotide phosphotransferase [Afipia felis ATCC 53690]SUU76126.1 polyphosphate:nucleotide phosphotransferase, PPK2 family [Afipia felis]SUU84193.1 polyphosphate:nucleotide phosphotransferase, PPK2 family [Afipia felis]
MGKKNGKTSGGKTDLSRYVDPFRVDGSREFHLKFHSTDEKGGVDKDDAKELLQANLVRLRASQEKLYAHDRWSLLLIFQGMDAAGKDSAIEHVMSGVNPQGCQVFSFKQPSSKELDHDFMWRSMIALPERGRIGIFNRSYYEEMLVVRVHPEILAQQKIPQRLVTKSVWRERFEDVSNIERYLTRNGTVILKFFLHVSKEEQRKRFLARLDEPAKNWKFSLADVKERALWDRYYAAYQEVLRHSSSSYAPWYVVPADHKWFSRLVISSTIVSTLEKLGLSYPAKSEASPAELKKARIALEKEGPPLRNRRKAVSAKKTAAPKAVPKPPLPKEIAETVGRHEPVAPNGQRS